MKLIDLINKYTKIFISKMNQSNKLSLEQEFKLTIYKKKIYKTKDINLKKHVIYLLKLMMIKDNLIKYFIKNEII